MFINKAIKRQILAMSKYKYGLKKYVPRMLLNNAVNIFVTSDSTPTAKQGTPGGYKISCP